MSKPSFPDPSPLPTVIRVADLHEARQVNKPVSRRKSRSPFQDLPWLRLAVGGTLGWVGASLAFAWIMTSPGQRGAGSATTEQADRRQHLASAALRWRL